MINNLVSFGISFSEIVEETLNRNKIERKETYSN